MVDQPKAPNYQSGVGILFPRVEVSEFADAMEAKLKRNDHKNHWATIPLQGLMQMLKLEIAELEVALQFLGPDEARDECVDVGNFAMMIRDVIAKSAAAHAKQQALDRSHGSPEQRQALPPGGVQ